MMGDLSQSFERINVAAILMISFMWPRQPGSIARYHAYFRPRPRLVANVCSGCGKGIDPDLCGCGVSKSNHDDWSAGHGFVPMGCDCLRAAP